MTIVRFEFSGTKLQLTDERWRFRYCTLSNYPNLNIALDGLVEANR